MAVSIRTNPHVRVGLAALFCLLSLAWAAPAAADASSADEIPLWRIDGGQSTVHLLGSIHALTRDHYPLPDKVNTIFESAGKVVFEVDVTRVSQQEIAAITQELGLYRPPATLAEEVSEKTLSTLEGFLSERELGIEQVNRLKPWFLGLQITVQELQRLGYNPALGLDMHFMQRAIGAGKPVGQLETFRQQMETLAADPPEIQDLALRTTIEDLDGYDAELKQLMAAWSRADTEALYQLAVDSMQRHPELAPQLDRIIHDRNRTMAEGIRELLGDETDALVIVGALHLGGEQGILALLGDDFRLTQIKTN